jgi:cation transport regulator ChaC
VIGVLSYGSLITNPGFELQAVTVGRIDNVLTPFHVEYARPSGGRGGAPTLVPVEDGGARVRAVILTVSASAADAADIVYRREINQVGSGKAIVSTQRTERAWFGSITLRGWLASISSSQLASMPILRRSPVRFLPIWRFRVRGK